jgi:aldehyde:ferredoxin oxidoreductase
MPITGGFTGNVLRVDLTTRTVTVEKTLEKYANYWGGSGMAYKALWDETTKDTKWSDPENLLCFNWGPLSGTGALCGGRCLVTAISPVATTVATGSAAGYTCTNGVVTSGHFGGYFASEAKYAGWDGIIVKGKSPGPCYIAIRDDDVQIVDAPQLWGSGLYRTNNEIMQAMGKEAQVAAIGQAGQNMVPQSVIMTGNSHSGGSTGAVMGSKNLVGIGVIGTGTVKIAAPKAVWSGIIDLAYTIIGSNNQHVVPNTPQPWAEYVSGTRWTAAKGRYWGAANPPVETGTCDPHDRQSVGYRCYKLDGVGNGDFMQRMDGCHACPIRCHNSYNLPSAGKWGVNTYATNTCVGWWGNGTMDANKYTTTTVGSATEIAMRRMEASVVGNHMTNDMGLHNNYGLTQGNSVWLFDGATIDAAFPGVFTTNAQNVKTYSVWNGHRSTNNLKPDGVTYYGIGEKYIKPNVGAAEWTRLMASGGLFDMWRNGDLNFLKEWGRIVAAGSNLVPANRQAGSNSSMTPWENKLGIGLGWPVEVLLDTWVASPGPGEVGVHPLRQDYGKFNGHTRANTAGPATYVGVGHPEHHINGHTGLLIQTGYNRDPQNHAWASTMASGLPLAVQANVIEQAFANAGLGAGFGSAANYDTPYNEMKAKAAWWAHSQKELLDALGICAWMYPLNSSPLKERGYLGDMTLEAQYFSAVTGMTKTTVELHEYAKRWYNLHRALTMRAWNSTDMRHTHDFIAYWDTYEAEDLEWDRALTDYYTEWGQDTTPDGLANGCPTKATLLALDMPEVVAGLNAQFPGSIWA